MELVFDKIHVPHKHSFIGRQIQHDSTGTARMHAHNNYELNFVVSGSGRRIVGNNISTFERGDIVLLGPDLPHCWHCFDHRGQGASRSIVLHFYENIINSNLFDLPELEEVEALLRKANLGICFRAKHLGPIERSLEKIIALDGLARFIELLKVFHFLLQVEDYEYISDTSYSMTYQKDLEKINLVYEYVFQHIQEGIRQEEAAALLHMTPGAFCRYFKKKTKRTFMAYVKSVRIRLAAKMLAETDKHISEICYECGYNNIANFNLQFKSVMQNTPSDYRKIFR